MLLVRFLLAIVSVVSALFAVAASCMDCSYTFDKSQNTPSNKKKAEIFYWIFFAIACFTGCSYVLWALAEVIINHSVMDFIMFVAYAVFFYKYGDI